MIRFLYALATGCLTALGALRLLDAHYRLTVGQAYWIAVAIIGATSLLGLRRS